MTIQQADAIKFLELLLSECSTGCKSGDHEWRKCRRCLAIAEVEGHHKLARGFVQQAITALKDAGAAALSRQREREDVEQAREALRELIDERFSPDRESPHAIREDWALVDAKIDALILAVQPSAALSPPSRQLEEYSAFLERINADDYLAYAARHIRAALLKESDDPPSAMQHERQARLALQVHSTRLEQSAALSQPSRQLSPAEHTDVLAAVNAGRWTRTQCGNCGATYRRCARCGQGVKGAEREGMPCAAGHSSDLPCSSDCIATIAETILRESAALVPQGCQTCGTCRHETSAGYCGHPELPHVGNVAPMSLRWGCSFHQPAPPLSTDPPQEK